MVINSGHPQYPLWKRVAVHLETLAVLVKNFDASSSSAPSCIGGAGV